MPIACPRCGASNDDRAVSCLNCGARLGGSFRASAVPDARVGAEFLGRYRIVGLLGEGGMGRVYLAEQAMGMGSRRIAIKTLQIDLSADPAAITRFQHECKTVCDLDHPNTIKFHDFGRLEDGALFIAMEYIEGQSLADALRSGAMPVERIDRILVQLCGSLAEAHQKGIVHRDLKPDNVLLTNRAGQCDFVKVLDFGIAKRTDPFAQQGAALTVQGTMLGTPPYMSPEQFRGEALDGRSDLYSLGVMVFEMLTGQLPFVANTPWEWGMKHMSEAPRALEEFPAAALVAPHRKEAVRRALAKRREERFADVHTFFQAFTGVQDQSSAWLAVTSGGALIPSRPALSTGPSAPLPTPSSLGMVGGTLVASPPAHPTPPPAPTPNSRALRWTLALAVLAVLGVGSGLVVAGSVGVRRSNPATPASAQQLARGSPAHVPTVPAEPLDTTHAPPTAPSPAPMPTQWLAEVHHRGSAVDAESALGPADGRFAQIPGDTFVTLETASGWAFGSDGTPAPDLELFVDPRSSPYQVEVGVGAGHDTFRSVAPSAAGRTSVDLDAAGVTHTQYVRIRNLGNAPVFLDAVLSHRVVVGVTTHGH